MSGLSCRYCKSLNIETQVRVIYNGRTVHVDSSALKASDWALTNLKTPCILQHVYVCQKCGNEEQKSTTYFKDKL